jgi:hypothetical protein
VAISPRNQPSNTAFNSKAFPGHAGLGKMLKKYKKNEAIFTQGEVAGAIFYIQKGKVKVTVLSEQGKEAVVGILAQGQFFGEGCLDGAKLRTSTTHLQHVGWLMPETYSSSRVPLNADERPHCPKCGAEMTLVRIARGPTGFDIRTFDCADCDHAHIVMAATDGVNDGPQTIVPRERGFREARA